jgi:hypothetical protein
MHVYSQLIPTIERVNLDLQDSYIATWNKEILASIGRMTRLIYDRFIHDKSQRFDSTLAIYSFHTTVPSEEIGLLGKIYFLLLFFMSLKVVLLSKVFFLRRKIFSFQ